MEDRFGWRAHRSAAAVHRQCMRMGSGAVQRRAQGRQRRRARGPPAHGSAQPCAAVPPVAAAAEEPHLRQHRQLALRGRRVEEALVHAVALGAPPRIGVQLRGLSRAGRARGVSWRAAPRGALNSMLSCRAQGSSARAAMPRFPAAPHRQPHQARRQRLTCTTAGLPGSLTSLRMSCS